MLSVVCFCANEPTNAVHKKDSPTKKDLSDSKRWHVSRSQVTSATPVITLGIASEYSWFHGYARWRIHIGAKNNRLKDGYSWWSVGVATELPGQNSKELVFRHKYLDREADTASSFNTSHQGWQAALSFALLRDVREPVERIFSQKQSIKEWPRMLTWRQMLLHRAAPFYGTDSSQYSALYAHSGMHYGDQTVHRDIPALDTIPRWRHIKSRISLADQPYEDQVIWRSVSGSSLEE